MEKFLSYSQKFASDNSRLAQWLRAIDTLNCEGDYSEFENDPIFKVLRNEVKLCNFSARYLMTVDMSDVDKAIERYEEKIEIAQKMLAKGLDISFIAEITGLPKYAILKLK